MGGELPARSPCGTWIILKIEAKKIIKYWYLNAKKRCLTGVTQGIKTHSDLCFNHFGCQHGFVFVLIPGLKPGLIWKIICPHLSIPCKSADCQDRQSLCVISCWAGQATPGRVLSALPAQTIQCVPGGWQCSTCLNQGLNHRAVTV